MRNNTLPDHPFYRFRHLEHLLSLSDSEYDEYRKQHPLKTGGVALEAEDNRDIVFGRHLVSSHFCLDPNIAFLQHGSYGACLKHVLQLQRKFQDALESNPCLWQNERVLEILVHATRKVAKFVGVHSPLDIVFVNNATIGTNTVLKSLELTAKDSVVTFSLGYGAVNRTIERIQSICPGVHHHVIKIDLAMVASPEFNSFLLEKFDEAIVELKERQRKDEGARIVAIFDTICSGTAARLPYEELAKICRKHGDSVLSVLDGAHGIGAIPLNIAKLDVDFAVSNLHKWMCASKGCAFLYVRKELQKLIYPLCTSHPHELGFWSEFAWTGTFDFAPYLASMASIDFFENVGQEKIQKYIHELCNQASNYLIGQMEADFSVSNLIRTHPNNTACMCFIEMPPLPADRLDSEGKVTWPVLVELTEKIREKHHVEFVLMLMEGKAYTRLSSQIYNCIEDYHQLAKAIKEEWK